MRPYINLDSKVNVSVVGGGNVITENGRRTVGARQKRERTGMRTGGGGPAHAGGGRRGRKTTLLVVDGPPYG